MTRTRIIAMLMAVACVSGCGDQPQSARREPPLPVETSTTEELLRAVEDAKRAAAATEPPKPAITLPELDGWVRSEPRSLPPDDHGFTVAYDHHAGLAVTLYQFTRGLHAISDDLGDGPTQEEMARAKSGIQQAVQLGYWQAAKETDNGIVRLGNSTKQALWSRYVLTVDSATAASDTYVWSHNNTFFKIRCTGRFQDSEAQTDVLSELLTALGNACR